MRPQAARRRRAWMAPEVDRSSPVSSHAWSSASWFSSRSDSALPDCGGCGAYRVETLNSTGDANPPSMSRRRKSSSTISRRSYCRPKPSRSHLLSTNTSARWWRCCATHCAACIILYFSGVVTNTTTSAARTRAAVNSPCWRTTLSRSGVSTSTLWSNASRVCRITVCGCRANWPTASPYSNRRDGSSCSCTYSTAALVIAPRPGHEMSAPARALMRLDLPTAVGPQSITTSRGAAGASKRSPRACASVTCRPWRLTSSPRPRAPSSALQRSKHSNRLAGSVGSVDAMCVLPEGRSGQLCLELCKGGGQSRQDILADPERAGLLDGRMRDAQQRMVIELGRRGPSVIQELLDQLCPAAADKGRDCTRGGGLHTGHQRRGDHQLLEQVLHETAVDREQKSHQRSADVGGHAHAP